MVPPLSTDFWATDAVGVIIPKSQKIMASTVNRLRGIPNGLVKHVAHHAVFVAFHLSGQTFVFANLAGASVGDEDEDASLNGEGVAHTILERHTEAVIKIIEDGLGSLIVTQVLCKAVVVSVGLLVEFELFYALRHDDYLFVLLNPLNNNQFAILELQFLVMAEFLFGTVCCTHLYWMFRFFAIQSFVGLLRTYL